MSPLQPPSPLPLLTGLGINAAVARPDGTRARQYGHQTWLAWTDTQAWIEHDGIRITVDPTDLAAAAGSMHAFVHAQVHRRLHALEGLREVFAAGTWGEAFDRAVWGAA